jgi:hypothetical protein
LIRADTARHWGNVMPTTTDRDRTRGGADVVSLRQQGLTLQAIADRAGTDRLSVFRHLQKSLSWNEKLALNIPRGAAA